MNEHYLKIWPEHFNNVKNGNKTFEIRKNDRAFQKGDFVRLKEFDPKVKKDIEGFAIDGEYTGRSLDFKIGDVYPIDAERVVFSLCHYHSRTLRLEEMNEKIYC